MPADRQYQISPVVQESVAHNTKVGAYQWPGKTSSAPTCPCSPFLSISSKKFGNATNYEPSQTLSNLQMVTASLFGVAAGILGLESYAGFLFYLALAALVTILTYLLRVLPSSSSSAAGQPLFSTARFFRRPYDFWVGNVFNGLPGFVLTWTLFYGIVRA